MNHKIVKTLVKKEMLDVFRDKKTVLMMLVVPIILYPLLIIGVMQVMTLITSGMEEQNYRIAVSTEAGNDFLKQYLQTQEDEAYQITLTEPGAVEDYELALNDEEIDVYVDKKEEDGKPVYMLYYLSSVTNSSYASNIVEDALEAYKEELRKQKIEAAGLMADEVLEPIAYEWTDIASSEQSLGSIMGRLLPFMLIISLLMGTMYPAIDTTAGERERGTLETILTLPVTNRQLIVGKFLTVAAIGLISAALNILSMGGIGFYMYKIMDLTAENGVASIAWGSFVPAILVTVVAVLAFSLFISAITMCVTAFAESYKEANNYITPLMLVVMITGYIAFIPNIGLTRTIAMIPVANISLLLRDLMAFKYDYMTIAIVIISNVAYAVLAILFLSKIYDSEAVLFGNGKGGIRLMEKRSNMKKGGVPNVSDAWFMAAFTVMMLLYAGGMLQIKFGLGGLFGTQMILLLLPLLFLIYTKRDIRATYSFRGTSPINYLGAFLLILGTTTFIMVLSVFLATLFPDSAGAASEALLNMMGDDIWLQILVIAITPAICEEMLFRGFLLSAMKSRYRDFTAILIVSALFGIYHMSLIKFFTTGILGFVLCYAVHLTGSIFPAMLMHFTNNLISVLLSYEPVGERLGDVFPMLYGGEAAVSDVLLLSGIAVLSAGVGLMLLRKNRAALTR